MVLNYVLESDAGDPISGYHFPTTRGMLYMIRHLPLSFPVDQHVTDTYSLSPPLIVSLDREL